MGILKLYFQNNAYDQRSHYKGLCSILGLQAKNGSEGDRNYEICTKMGGGGGISVIKVV